MHPWIENKTLSLLKEKERTRPNESTKKGLDRVELIEAEIQIWLSADIVIKTSKFLQRIASVKKQPFSKVTKLVDATSKTPRYTCLFLMADNVFINNQKWIKMVFQIIFAARNDRRHYGA